MSRYWELETVVEDNTNRMGNGDLDYEVYGQIAILLNKYVRKEKGKGLSTNDFTDEYRTKLDGIEDKAQVNVLETISINEGIPIHADENKNIDIFVPTKTSEIENDSDFAVTSEDTTFTEDFNVLGDTSLKDIVIDGDLTVLGDTSLKNMEVDDNLTVNGISTLNDDTEINGDLSVNGNTTLNNIVISRNATIHGDLYVDGVTHTTTEEQINTTSDTIVLRQNNSTSLGSTYSGIVINHYNGTNELALVTDSDGTLRLGTGVGSETLYPNIYWDDYTEKWYSDSTLETEVTPQGSLTSWESFETIGDIKHYTNAIFTIINFDGLVPIMCRDEDTDMEDSALLKWNSNGRVSKTIDVPIQNNTYLKANIDNVSGEITYSWGAGGGVGVSFIGTRANYDIAKLIPVGTEGHIPSGSLVIITDETDYVNSEDR